MWLATPLYCSYIVILKIINIEENFSVSYISSIDGDYLLWHCLVCTACMYVGTTYRKLNPIFKTPS